MPDEKSSKSAKKDPESSKNMKDDQDEHGEQGAQSFGHLTLPTKVEFFRPEEGRWSRWLMRLEDTFDCFGVTDEAQMKKLLLHYMGLKAYDKLCDRIAPKLPREMSYKEIVAEVTEIFDPTPLEIVEVNTFHERKQGENETCADFLAALRKLSTNCNFGCKECDNLTKTLRNQFVAGLWNKAIKKRLLEKRNLTLELAFDIARAMETSEKGEEKLQESRKQSINKLAEDEKFPPTNDDAESVKRIVKKCFKCGSATHLANRCQPREKVEEGSATERYVDDLKEEFKKVFDDSLGKINGIQGELKLKHDAKPVFLKARTVPIAKKEAVEREIESLVNEGVLIKVNQSRWATPIVAIPKASGKVRVCGDYSCTVNPNLIVDRYPLPTIEELLADMAGGQKFTKIDLSQAYLQMEIKEEDRELLTLSTHKGLYMPTRLMYGVASAVAIWQRTMESLLQDIPGVKVFLDDIRITGANDEEHHFRLREVLKR
ncbi:uncharacterized protein LOC129806739 [Phlebotomus papatasi]|uniref:uncharacterized protein LOC129803725 n=1 Tax=Phlebotomus papatasi TaxID=29031 RepID=UPI002483F729|nr:uncharacterized protein LOC129803725 [Phlebotomus papatasi]XP_055711487.1 uncharacterized protein LOC129806739 [Phlebotomus papatasi]